MNTPNKFKSYEVINNSKNETVMFTAPENLVYNIQGPTFILTKDEYNEANFYAQNYEKVCLLINKFIKDKKAKDIFYKTCMEWNKHEREYINSCYPQGQIVFFQRLYFYRAAKTYYNI